jgi:hypothetical protein
MQASGPRKSPRDWGSDVPVLDGGTRIECRDAALRGLDCRNVVAESRPSQGAANVVSMSDGTNACGDRCSSAAGGAAARYRVVPRVQRQSMKRVIGEATHGELWGVGEADDNRAGLLQVGCHWKVAGCDVILEADDAVGVCLSLDIDVDLDRHRHAVELAEDRAVRPRAVGGAGVGNRLLTQIDDDRVERRVHRVHPLDMSLDHLLRGDNAVSDRGGRLERRPMPDRACIAQYLPRLAENLRAPPAGEQRERSLKPGRLAFAFCACPAPSRSSPAPANPRPAALDRVGLPAGDCCQPVRAARDAAQRLLTTPKRCNDPTSVSRKQTLQVSPTNDAT